MASPIVLAVGHGSRSAEAVAQFHEFVAALARRIDQPVNACFLELADPDLANALNVAAQEAGQGGRVLVAPMFLGRAGHYKTDIPSALHSARTNYPTVDFRLAAPLGPHAKLVELLRLRVREAEQAASEILPASQTILLLVGRGSSDPGANSELARLAYLAGYGQSYLSVEYAFQAVGRPNMEEAVHRCAQLGARQIVVAPFLLFAGRVNDDIRAVTDRAATNCGLRIVHATYLGVHPLLVDVAMLRLQEARQSAPIPNCDLCQYRFALPGHERHPHIDEKGRADACH